MDKEHLDCKNLSLEKVNDQPSSKVNNRAITSAR